MQTEYLRKIVCKVCCGDENGTGFLIEANKIITASHVISEFSIEKPISIKFSGKETLFAIPLNDNWQREELAILVIERNEEITMPSLYEKEIVENEQVTAYGFLSNDESSLKIDGTISQIWGIKELDDSILNFELKIDNERIEGFGGFSGSPIIKENNIYGVLICQKIENKQAIRLKGVGNKAFKDFLNSNEVKYLVVENKIPKEDINYPNQSMNLLSEISNKNKIYFEIIQKDLLQKNSINTWEKLENFLETLNGSNDSNKNKANYYYLSSIWAHNENKLDISEHYYNQALILDSELDTRIYSAINCINSNDYTSAKKILLPINGVNILNIYLSCIYNECGDLSNALAIVDTCVFDLNSETNRLLSLFSLKEKNFLFAKDYIEKSIMSDSENHSYQMIKALILYSEGINQIVKDECFRDFLILSNTDFIPSIDETRLLEKSLRILNSLATKSTNSKNYIEILCAKFIVSSVLPNKDLREIIEALQSCDRLNAHAILFSVIFNIEIKEDIISEFMKLEVYDNSDSIHLVALYELSIKDKNFEVAGTLLRKYSKQISAFTGISIEELKVMVKIEQGDFLEAKTILSKSEIHKNSKKRLEIMIDTKRGITFSKSMIKDIVQFAKSTKKSIDYRNANFICKKYEFWKEMKANAQNWVRVVNTPSALIALSESLINLKDYKKAFKKIEYLETISGVSAISKKLKINCLAGLSLFEEAIELSQTISNNFESAELVMFQAKSYLSLGNKSEAILLLKSYAKKHIDREIYQLLIESIKGEDPESATEYAYKLYSEYPNDIEIIGYCGQVGVSNGHKELSEKFFSVALKSDKNPFQVQMLGIDEVKKIIGSSRNESFERYKNLINGKISVHQFSDLIKLSMGEFLYLHKSNYGISGNYILTTPESLQINTNNIVLDYTVCATLFDLGLLNKVKELFNKVYLSNKLLPTILFDIQKTFPTQKHLIEKKQKLIDFLNKFTYTTIENSDNPTDIDEKYNRNDQISIYNAEKYNFKYITDHSSGSILDELVPTKWSNYQIFANEFYYKLSELQLKHPATSKEDIRNEVVNSLVAQDNILLDEIILIELLDSNSLDGVFSAFNVFIEESTLDSLRQSVVENEQKHECAGWLKSLSEQIKWLVEKKEFIILPTLNSNVMDGDNYFDILIEEINLLSTDKYCIGIDDRMCSQVKFINNGENVEQKVFNTLDIVNLLFEKNIIDKTELYDIYDKLIEMKYSVFIPPPEYIFSRLKLTKACEDGHLIETHQLSNFRKYITHALNSQNGVSRQHSNYINSIEVVNFFLRINEFERGLYLLIFNSGMKQEWANAAATWLLMSTGDKMINIFNHEISDIQLCSHKILLLLITTLKDKVNDNYSNWISNYVSLAIESDKLLNQSVAAEYAKHLNEMIYNNDSYDNQNNLDKDTQRNEKVNAALLILQKLPVNLVHEILKVNCMKEIKKIITFKSKIEFDKEKFNDILPNLNIDKILLLDEDELENSILYVLSEPNIRGKELLGYLNENSLMKITTENRNRMIRFLFELSWYLPSKLQKEIYIKKEFLTLL